MNIKEIFKKQGGISLIKRYWQSGVLLTAVTEFILLGKSRTALEILRLSTQLKTKQKLEKKYRSSLAEFNRFYEDSGVHEQSNKIWVCWFQGMDQAPILVKRCYKSLKDSLTNREIIVVTSDNMLQYVEFPDFILEKWRNGQISHTHMTDLLRLELLIKYGGMWIDATVLCTRNESEIPPYFFDSDLFLYQQLKPGRDGQSTYISSWLISAKSNNKLLMATRYLCYKYWEKNNQMIDYFLFHEFLSIVLEVYPEEWNKIVPQDNATPHILQLRLFEQYDEKMYENVIAQSPFHKLSYKFTEEEMLRKGTYYDVIVADKNISL